jgi:uncharacterized protein (TIGR00369 family)
MPDFNHAAASHLLATAFAPWVLDLGLSVESLTADGATLRMTFSDRLCRDGGVICGQAMMALADTAMVIAVVRAAGGYLPMTTVDQTSHFLKPASGTDLLADARVARIGKTMAFATVAIHPANDERPVALAQAAFALMRDAK